MKKNIKSVSVIALLALTIGILIGWLLFGNSPSSNSTHSIQSTENDQTWTCSMHPQIRKLEPGECPICGMDLIPIQIEAGEGNPLSIEMSPTAMQLANIKTEMVVKKEARKTLLLNGKVQSDERRLFTQSSHIPGRIEKLLVNFTGEKVAKGQILAYVYSPELVTAQEELFEAKKIQSTQPQLFEAAKEKLRNWKLTNSQISQILESEISQEEFPILADVSGFVTEKKVNLGDHIMEGDGLYEIADLSRVWVLFDIYESDMPWIKKSDIVSFSVQSIPGEAFSGEIKYIDPVINPISRVAKARLEIRNPQGKLKPEMFVSGKLESTFSNSKNVLAIPKTSVMWTGQRSVVYIRSTSGNGIHFVMQEIILGPDLGDFYVVESGLEVGMEIAVSGTFSIDAAAQLAGKPSMMSPDGGIPVSGHNHGQGAMEGKSPSVKSNLPEGFLSESEKKLLERLYRPYFGLKNALTEDDFVKSKDFALDLLSNFEKIEIDLFEEENQIRVKGLLEGLENSLEHIPHLTTIEEFRMAFIGISNSMISIAKELGTYNGDLFVQFCPMANNDKGASWLSLDEEIKNPYFGSAMLTCGETVQTLKSN